MSPEAVDSDRGLRLKLPEWGRFLTQTGRHQQAIGGKHFLLTVRATTARALAGAGRDGDAVALAAAVWAEIEGRSARMLPYPIESIVDCAKAFGSADPRYPKAMDLARRVADEVVADITDPTLQASFLDLVDVRFVLEPRHQM